MINFLLLSLLASLLLSPGNNPKEKNIGELWNELDRRILLKQADKDSAITLMNEYSVIAAKYFMDNNGRYVSRSEWVFPLLNFTETKHRDEGNDYKDTGYDYFQGSDSKGHPAHDIMILDDNKDLLEDNTGKPVDVVSMSSGIVISTDTTWKPGSFLRGGKFVKIFDVTNKKIFYYSHLSTVTVKPGDILNAGYKIGEVGRTGRKAILLPGKTHLHVALLKLEKGYPKPEPVIEDVLRSKIKVKSEK